MKSKRTAWMSVVALAVLAAGIAPGVNAQCRWKGAGCKVTVVAGGSETKGGAAVAPAKAKGCSYCTGQQCTAACRAKAGKACSLAAGKTCSMSRAKAQTTCPVMGGKINKKYYADYQGKRVYFCCPDCIAAFKKAPARYVRKLEKQGVTLAGVPQTMCPVMGGEINKKYYADYQGKRVYFCCPACIAPFKKAPAKYLKKLDAEGVTPAAICPKCGQVMGSPQCCVKPPKPTVK